jgi:hypothetical protein
LPQLFVAVVKTCHWTVGVGVPDADALNGGMVAPATTVSEEGSPVITGGLFVGGAPVTVKVAGFVVVLPPKPVNVASYSYPFCEVDAVKE